MYGVQRKYAGGIQNSDRQAITVPGDIHRNVTIGKFNVKNSNSSQVWKLP